MFSVPVLRRTAVPVAVPDRFRTAFYSKTQRLNKVTLPPVPAAQEFWTNAGVLNDPNMPATRT
jgi:hypothetical protein